LKKSGEWRRNELLKEKEKKGEITNEERNDCGLSQAGKKRWGQLVRAKNKGFAPEIGRLQQRRKKRR